MIDDPDTTRFLLPPKRQYSSSIIVLKPVHSCEAAIHVKPTLALFDIATQNLQLNTNSQLADLDLTRLKLHRC
jgi:hypothetical protein